MNNRYIVMFLLWTIFLPIHHAAGQVCRGFERSEDNRDDPRLDQVRAALLENASLEGNEFEFVRSIKGRFYVFTGSDFVFVDTFGKPEKHYVSHLCHVDSGKVNVFWLLDRKSKKVFFISYEGKRNDGTQGKHVFYLEVSSDDDAWCNDVIGLETMPQANPERTAPTGGRLRDVRLIDVDHDDFPEILCSFEPDAAGEQGHPRTTLLFRQEKVNNDYKIVTWKPTYSREFFDTLFRRMVR
ncbi:MAG TPA: hypothetical protein PKM25_04000 [Candidatus Ozemobacteraceae bacterium]|nr:hypothetical protein [Candidatus Ozemobacteraceae bacterium]